MNRSARVGCVLLLLATVSGPAFAQRVSDAELTRHVPALAAMHGTVSMMWHDAWPARDVATLTRLAPKFGKHMRPISKAQLPRILMSRHGTWLAGIETLAMAVSAYQIAAREKDEEGLMRAAAAVHNQYEVLAGMIRAPVKELSDLHPPLFRLYYYQREPEYASQAGRSIAELRPKIEALKGVTLTDRFRNRQAAFDAQRARLARAYASTASANATIDRRGLAQGIEWLYLEYEKLESLLR